LSRGLHLDGLAIVLGPSGINLLLGFLLLQFVGVSDVRLRIVGPMQAVQGI